MHSGTRTSIRSWNIAESSVLTQLLWITTFAVATALGARVEIPHYPVPFTLQTMVVLLAGAFLGARNGAYSQILYLGAGLIGLPVFAGGAFGFMKIAGPTGGYLLAFPIAAAAAGYLVRMHKGFPGSRFPWPSACCSYSFPARFTCMHSTYTMPPPHSPRDS